MTRDRHSDQLLSSKMETIIRYPGLHHLAEKVFWNLDGEDLRTCAQMNQFCKQILQHPIFCLRTFKGLANKNRDNWIKVIQSMKIFHAIPVLLFKIISGREYGRSVSTDKKMMDFIAFSNVVFANICTN